MQKLQGLKQKAQLRQRLAAWDEAVTVTRTNCKPRNWLHYTAAVGSALAMVTDASASGGIIYTPGPVTAAESAQNAFTIGQATFRLSALKNSIGEGAFLTAVGHHAQVLATSHGGVQKLASGAAISSGDNFWAGNYHWLKSFFNTTGGGQKSAGSFKASSKAFAGIRFTIGGTSANPTPYQYGWVRLEYGASPGSQVPISVTMIDDAYQSAAGTGIAAGAGAESSTPEPGTLALSLLALGAAGVLALRRQKKAVSA